jgi:hypothetical protein
MTITPQQMALAMLLIQNAIAAAFNTVGKMTPEEVAAATTVEEAKKAALMAEINAH